MAIRRWSRAEIGFHCYLPLSALWARVEALRGEGRPIVCTEWLARSLGSRVETHLPWFRSERIGCLHWGLVTGRTQTHLPWPGFGKGAPPDLWFHDLLRPDGTPYDPSEVEFFRGALRGAGRARHPA